MSERELKNRNQNPWYILMTLHGEQEGDEIDWDLHKENQKTWNDIMSNRIPDSAQDHLRKNGIRISVRGRFHEVLDEVRRRFVEVYQLRNPDSVTEVRMPRFDGVVDLQDIHSPNHFVAAGMAFGHDLNVNRSCFEKEVNFKNSGFAAAFFAEEAIFEQNIALDASVVLRGLCLQRATLNGALSANELVVEGDCNFGCTSIANDVRASKIRVGGNFSMERLPLNGGLNAERAEFRGQFNADGATIRGTADFVSSVFSDTARFVGIKLCGPVSFASSSFHGDAVFRNAQFLAPADFPVVNFQGHADFTEARFQSAVSRTLTAVRFEGSVFCKFTSFRYCRFLTEYPDFFGATLFERTGFTAEKDCWPSVRKDNNDKAKDACGIIRHAVAKQSMPEEEHFFFRREMHHAARAAPFWRAAHIYLYEALSNFGYSIARPAVLLALLWAIGAWLYATQAALGWLKGAAYSFSVMFKFFGFQRTYLMQETNGLTQTMEAVSAGQTVLAFVLLFFLGLGLRTRFRLR